MGDTHIQGRTRRERTLVEDRHGQVGYAPAAFLVVVLDTTAEEEESGKKGQEDSTEENRIGGWIGQEGERRKSYSAAVIDGTKRNSRIYVGDSIVRKTDTRLNRGEDVVVCLPGATYIAYILNNCPPGTPHICFVPQDPDSLRNIWVCSARFRGLVYRNTVPDILLAWRVVEELIG